MHIRLVKNDVLLKNINTYFLTILDPKCDHEVPQKWISHHFRHDHQLIPENRPIKDSKTAEFLDFQNNGRLPPFLDWTIKSFLPYNSHNY